jgi:hypothetical protein
MTLNMEIFIGLFEFKKPLKQVDEEILRDFRVTWNPDVLATFKSDVTASGVYQRIIQPAPRAFIPPTVVTTTPAGDNKSSSKHSSVRIP